MRIFTEFSVSFRERFTYFVYKTKTTIFFSIFPAPLTLVKIHGERNRLGRIKIVSFRFRGDGVVSNEMQAVASSVHKLRFGHHVGPIGSRIALRGVVGQIIILVEKYNCD